MDESTTDEPVEQPIETRTRVPREDLAGADGSAEGSEDAATSEDAEDSGSDPFVCVTRMPPDSASG